MTEHRRRLAALAVVAAVFPIAACSGAGGPTSAAHAGTSAAPTATAMAGPVPREVAGVTEDGGLVLIDPTTGATTRTLVHGASAVRGDDVSATSGGTVFFEQERPGCANRISSIPASGGDAAFVVDGALPAVSPDGSQLAYAREPRHQCGKSPSPSQYALVVRDLRSGVERVFPVAPELARSGLPYPIDHLSWAADGHRILLSAEAPEDNAGWALIVLDTRTSWYYRTGVPGEPVPVTGSPLGLDYYREGVFMPDGDLFVNRVCCIGMGPGPRQKSTLLWEVTLGGALVQQVAVGFTDRDHTSLAADPGSRDLLYLAGSDLYVSDAGQRPRLVASGLVAATWVRSAG